MARQAEEIGARELRVVRLGSSGYSVPSPAFGGHMRRSAIRSAIWVSRYEVVSSSGVMTVSR